LTDIHLVRPSPDPVAGNLNPEAEIDVRFGLADSPFGPAFVAWTETGLCHLSFAKPAPSPGSIPEPLHADFRSARWLQDADAALLWARRIFAHQPGDEPITLAPRGTSFQIKVWQELLRTQPGTTLSYRELASRLGTPSAARAVGGAVGANRIGFLIPCHRVIRSDGSLGGFAWGLDCKRHMLAWEKRGRSD
jgi:AraC family transcriptional regulator of adaptative response/methylated-DNA-[protein]-cysteine methyltransferase